MIRLTRLNGKDFILNCELIKILESTPDTVITLTTGEKLMVKESIEIIIRDTINYRQRLNQSPAFLESNGSANFEYKAKNISHSGTNVSGSTQGER